MERIKLKKSDLQVSRLCVGGFTLGQYECGQVDKSELIATVHYALDAGINFFDTADTYGLGESERTLSEALGSRRHEAIIATKFGVRVIPGRGTIFDNSRTWLEEALFGSLKRLNTDYIDLYQIHNRDGKTSIAELVDNLDRLKAKGYIRYYGFSNIGAADIDEIEPYKDSFISVQNEYSLANRSLENDLHRFTAQLNLTPMTWGSLGEGILTGKYDGNTIFDQDDRRSRKAYVNFHGEKLAKNLLIVDEMRSISERTGKSIPAIAIRFILDNLPESVVIAGVKNQEQLTSNISALDWYLDEEDLKTLRAISA